MRVVLYGSRADGHAKVCLRVIDQLPDWSCAGCLDDVPGNRGNRLDGLTVLGGTERLASLPDEGVEGVVLAFGLGRARLQRLDAVREAGLRAPPLIDPTASVAPTSQIADGAVVLRGALVGDDCSVEAAGLVNIGAILTHDVVMGQASTVGPGSVLAGRSRLETGAEVGANATLLPDAAVGKDAVVGAGAVVLRSVAPGTTVAGVPAEPIGPRVSP